MQVYLKVPKIDQYVNATESEWHHKQKSLNILEVHLALLISEQHPIKWYPALKYSNNYNICVTFFYKLILLTMLPFVMCGQTRFSFVATSTLSAFVWLVSAVNNCMSAETCLIRKLFVTLRAAVWLFACVHSDMPIKIKATGKVFVAEVTHMTCKAIMYSYCVCMTWWWMSKYLITMMTGVLKQTSMYRLMQFQIWCLWESFVAIRTLVRFDTSVNPLVLIQMRCISKPHITVCTLEMLLGSVILNVFPPYPLGFKFFFAQWTNIWSVNAIMYFPVHFKILHLLETLIAKGTFIRTWLPFMCQNMPFPSFCYSKSLIAKRTTMQFTMYFLVHSKTWSCSKTELKIGQLNGITTVCDLLRSWQVISVLNVLL